MHHWMFNCKKVTRMISESLDRELPVHQRLGIRVHLLMCKFCSRYQKQILGLRETIRLYVTHEKDIEPYFTLTPEAKKRIKRSMQVIIDPS